MAYADVRDGEPDTIYIQASWAERDLMKQVPGCGWDGNAKIWHAPFSWAGVLIMRGLLQSTLVVSPALNLRVWNEREVRIDRAMELRGRTFPHLNRDDMTKLYRYQEAGVEWLLTAGDCILADDMGVGKTMQLIMALKEEDDASVTAEAFGMEARSALPAVIVCPNGVKHHWRKSLNDWMPDAHVFVYEGSPTKRAKVIDAFRADPDGILVVNYESMRQLSRLAPFGSVNLKACRQCRSNGEAGLPASRCQVHPKVLNQITVRTYIVDEIHRAKDPKSLVTRALWAAMHNAHVTRRWGATGTPMANDPGDTWAMMHAVAPLDYPSRSEFVDRYCLAQWSPYGNLDIVGIRPEHREEFFKILDTRFRRMPKGLVLPQLPPVVRQQRMVTMPPKMAKHYRELRDNMITNLGGDAGLLVAPGSLLQQRRMMQLCSSMCEVDDHGSADPQDWTVRLVEPSPKLDALEECLDELGDRQVTVCAVSRQLIEMAAARLTKAGVKFGMITGKQNEWERTTALERFQGGKDRVLLYTVQAGGTGLTMTAADTQIYLQRSWSMIDSVQADGRVHRIGSERHESVTYIDLITEDTIEVDQIEKMQRKYQRMEEINRDIATLSDAGKSTAEVEQRLYGIMHSHIGDLI